MAMCMGIAESIYQASIHVEARGRIMTHQSRGFAVSSAPTGATLALSMVMTAATASTSSSIAVVAG